eukprot:143804_1
MHHTKNSKVKYTQIKSAMIPTRNSGTQPISYDDVNILLQRIEHLEAEKKEYIKELDRANLIKDEFKQTIDHIGKEQSLTQSQSEILSQRFKAHSLTLEHQSKTNFQLRLMLQEHIATIDDMRQQNKLLQELNEKYNTELETVHKAFIQLQTERQNERLQYELKKQEIECLIREIQALENRRKLPVDTIDVDSSSPNPTPNVLSPQLLRILVSDTRTEKDLHECLAGALQGFSELEGMYSNQSSPNTPYTAGFRIPERATLKVGDSYESVNYSPNLARELQSLKEENEVLNDKNEALRAELKEQDVKLNDVIRTFQKEKTRMLKLQNDEYIEMECKLNQQIEQLHNQQKEYTRTINVPSNDRDSFWSCYFWK